MAERPKSSFEMKIDTGSAPSPMPVSPSTPFRMLLLGDFTGRANRQIVDTAGLATRRLITVDRDNFDDVLKKLQPTLELRLGSDQASPTTITFQELDDFHPDRLFERVELFEQLRRMRRRLMNNDLFAQAAAELRAGNIASVNAPETNSPSLRPPVEVPTEGLLDAAMEVTEQTAAATTPIDRIIQEIIAPYIEPAADPRQPEYVAAVDNAIGEQMRRLLHHPEFQELEATWRGLSLLIRRLETDSTLTLELLDVSPAEIGKSLSASDDPLHSEIGKLLSDQSTGTPGSNPFGCLIGLFDVQPTTESVAAVGGLARIAKQLGTALLAGAHPRFAGCESFAASADPADWTAGLNDELASQWKQVRKSDGANLSLLAPRFLLRLPYGKKTDATESFAFEELLPPPDHAGYLWGHSAILGALHLGVGFTVLNWELRTDASMELDGLPVHTFEDDDGERVQKPCAEAWLTERSGDALAAHGLTAVYSVRNRDAVLMPGLRNAADPPGKLQGPWS